MLFMLLSKGSWIFILKQNFYVDCPKSIQTIKNQPAMQETCVWSLGWEDSLEKGMATPTPVFLPRESHEWKSLAGYNPQGHRVGHDWAAKHTQEHTGEKTNFYFTLAFSSCDWRDKKRYEHLQNVWVWLLLFVEITIFQIAVPFLDLFPVVHS